MNKVRINRDNNFSRINSYLLKMEEHFIPKLSTLVNIHNYSNKLSKKAFCYFARCYDKDVGMVSFYINYANSKSFISSLSVCPDYQYLGIGKLLLKQVECISKSNNISHIELEVSRMNINAINFYKNNGYKDATDNTKSGSLILSKLLREMP